MMTFTLRNTLFASFGLVSLLSILGFGVVAERIANDLMDDSVHRGLRMEARQLVSQLELKRERWSSEASSASRSELVLDAVEQLHAADEDTEALQQVGQKLDPVFESVRQILNAYDIILISPKGLVFYTVKREKDLYTRLDLDDAAPNSLAAAAHDALSLNRTGFAWALQYKPSQWALAATENGNEVGQREGNEQHSSFVVSPVMVDGRAVAALAIQLKSGELSSMWAENIGQGDTGEMVIANRQGESIKILNQLRNLPADSESTQISADSSSSAIATAVARQIGSGEGLDYRGKPVFYALGFLPGLDLGVVAKIDRDEALAPIDKLRERLFISSLIGVLVALAIAAGLSAQIVRFLNQLAGPSEHEGSQSQSSLQTNSQSKLIPKELQPLADRMSNMRGQVSTLMDELVQQKQALDQHAVVALVDRKGAFSYVNERFERCLGYSSEQIIGQEFHSLLLDEQLEVAGHKNSGASILALDDSKVRQGELLMRTAQGERRWFDISVVPILDLGGEIKTHVIIQTDITEGVEATEALEVARGVVQQQLEESQQLNMELEALVAASSHDLKSPLIAIAQLSAWVAEDDGPNLSQDSRDHLALVKSRCMHMQNLLGDLVNYCRLGSELPEAETLTLQQLVDATLALNSLPQDFKLEVAENELHGLRVPLELIVRNLIGNAVKHGDEQSSTIRVSYRREQQWQVLRVEDDGPGIPAELRDKAAAMFSTLDSRDRGGGSGMGLALVKKAAFILQGEMHIEARSGRGTVIDVSWPSIDEPPES